MSSLTRQKQKIKVNGGWWKEKKMNEIKKLEENEKKEFEITIKKEKWKGKPVFFFNRHREVALCWFQAIKEGLIKKDNLVITIDAHNDLMAGDVNYSKEEWERICSMNEEQLKEWIESKGTQDQFQSGMENGIIGDMIVISPQSNKRQFRDREAIKEYKDSKGKIHKITYYENIEEFDKEFKLSEVKKDILLDIDLDYFTVGQHISPKQLESNIGSDIRIPKLKEVINRSKIITFALEPDFTCLQVKWREKTLFKVTEHLKLITRNTLNQL